MIYAWDVEVLIGMDYNSNKQACNKIAVVTCWNSGFQLLKILVIGLCFLYNLYEVGAQLSSLLSFL